ncbi:MAG: HlyC/CorC family transporter [Ignavibacteriales bacterium]|nr:HlyC/CorC family transporter [Ignavibacteriales bacterium]
MTLLLIYGFVSIFFSFLCSILEAVLLSITPTFISIKKKEGKSYALTLEELKKDVDKPLIAILTLNTIAHTVGAILVGVQSETAFGSGNNVVGIVSAIMTFLILVVSEIIPKTIGATYWKQLANFTSKALVLLIFPLKWTGIIWLMQITTKLIGKNNHGSVLSREDFSVMAEIAKEKGVFDESESRYINKLLNFNKILVRDIMTPRVVVKSANANQNILDYFNENKNLTFTRIPIYVDSPDNITDYILKDDILNEIANDKHDKKLSDLKRKILIVKNNMPIPILFQKFIEEKEHIALIIDEYGSFNGIVTMEDVIETLLGLEIVDESDTHTDMQKLARARWEERTQKYNFPKNKD